MSNRKRSRVCTLALLSTAPLIAAAQVPDLAGLGLPDVTDVSNLTPVLSNHNEVSAAPVRVYFNDFDGNEFRASGISGGITWGGAAESVQGYAGLGPTANQFTGKFWRNAATGNPAQATRLMLSGLPAHKSINLRFLLAIIDTWDGSTGNGSPDYLNVAVNGSIVFSQTFSAFNLTNQSYAPLAGGQLTWNTQRGFNASYGDAAYDMTIDPSFALISHSATILTVDFFASGGGWEGGTNESWAIENLEVQISDEGPDPTPPFTDAISREVSVYQLPPPFEFTDAISREVSVFAYEGPNPLFTDATSREVSVFVAEAPVEFTDAMSREVSVFSVLPLTLGTPYNGVLAPGTWLFFSLVTPANQTLRVDLNHSSTTAWTELYASFGKVPDTLNAEFSSDTPPGQPDQELIVPNTQAGTYYILARCTNDPNPSASKSFSLLADLVPFGVESVEPQTVGAGEEVTLRVTGGQLDSASAFAMRSSSGGPDIPAANISIIDGAHARVRLNLLGVPLGLYDFVADSANSHRTLPRAVTLDAPSAVRVDQQVIPSPALARLHGAIHGTTRIILRNSSNIDAPFVLTSIFAPSDPALHLSLDAEQPLRFVDTGQRESLRLFSSMGPGEQLNLVIPIDIDRSFQQPGIPIYVHTESYARNDFREAYLLGPTGVIQSVVDLVLTNWSSPDPWFFSEFVPQFRQAVLESYDSYDAGESSLTLNTADAFTPCVYSPGIGAQGPCPHWSCLADCLIIDSACSTACSRSSHQEACIQRICPYVTPRHPDGCWGCCDNPCSPQCSGYWHDAYCATITCDDLKCSGPSWCMPTCDYDPVLCSPGSPKCKPIPKCISPNCTDYNPSADPNEKVGPTGFGDDRFVQSKSMLTFRVDFENVGRGPAAEVYVSDTLDASLDISSFRPRQFNFGSTTIEVPDGRSTFDTTIDRTSDLGLLIQLQSTVDLSTHQAIFDLRALDPETRQLPSELDRGFLLPEDGSGRGEGYVLFSISPLESAVHTGSVIKNMAPITFDYNLPLDTNEVFNTIDAAAPTSVVSALPAIVHHGKFNVCWSGEDDAGGSGVAAFTIFASDNSASYAPWATNRFPDCAAYTGALIGHNYAFYSVAQDNVGHTEVMPTDQQSHATVPDTITTVRFGDFNGDGKADGSDYFKAGQPSMNSCISGPKLQGVCQVLDEDSDADVDLHDVALLQNASSSPVEYYRYSSCQTGPRQGIPVNCTAEDFDLNGQADLFDFAAFQVGFGGPQ